MTREVEVRSAIERMLSNFVDLEKLEVDTDIFAEGFVNSLLALQIVYHLEEQFGFEIDEEDLHRENFSSIANLTRFTLRKQAACAPVS